MLQEIDRFSGKSVNDQNCRRLEADMHVYNDDFGNAMLQTASDIFDDESYRDAAYKNTIWLAEQLVNGGGFPEDCPSGIPVSLMYFYDLGNFYCDSRLKEACDIAMKKLLSMQYANTGDTKLDGGIRGAYEGMPHDGPNVNMRSSAYALVALLKLESDLPNVWLGRFNKQFEDTIPDPIDDVLPW